MGILRGWALQGFVRILWGWALQPAVGRSGVSLLDTLGLWSLAVSLRWQKIKNRKTRLSISDIYLFELQFVLWCFFSVHTLSTLTLVTSLT